MNKAQLIDAIASKTSLSKKESLKVLNAVTDSIVGALQKGERVSIYRFGSFSTSERKARIGRNPRTGKPINIAAKTVIKYKPSVRVGPPFGAGE